MYKSISRSQLALFLAFLIVLLSGSSNVQADFQFNDFSSVNDLIFIRDAAKYSSRLRLTPADEYKSGAVWYATKQDVAGDFETTFQFQLTGYRQNMPADGFAFVIQNSDVSAMGLGGGWMGFTDITNSIAVEFDTYQNVWEYYIDHISILTNGEQANSSDHAFSLGTSSQVSIADGNIHTVRIRYIQGTLSIYLDNANTPILYVSINLSEVLQLEEGKAWVGFTAATGGLYANYDILNWEFQVSPSFDEKPIIDGFPCQTAIADISFISPQPLLRSGTLPVNWSILNNPEGMIIDSVTGVVQWEHPVQGYYDITVSASNAEGSDYIEWQLVVVENDFEDPVIISSKYVDFVVPPHIAQWIKKYGAASYADACWELMRDTVICPLFLVQCL